MLANIIQRKQNRNVIVLAFDPGTKIIGWCVLENLNANCIALNIVATGKLKGTNSHDKGLRDIQELIEIHKPDFLAYEKAGQLTTVFKRIIENAVKTFQIPCIGYTVPNVRSELFEGKQKKSDSLFALKERITTLKKDVSAHELDALSIALYALNMKLIEPINGNTSNNNNDNPV